MLADLREANFSCANLQKARFWRSCLAKAILLKADLSDADLGEADFQEADMRGCILTRADVGGTNLQQAKGLTVEQILSAQNWKEATYDPEFLALLEPHFDS